MANTKSQRESLNAFLQWPGTKQGRLFSPLLLNRLLQVLAIATGHENEIKRLQIKRKKYNGPCLETAYSKKPKGTTYTPKSQGFALNIALHSGRFQYVI